MDESESEDGNYDDDVEECPSFDEKDEDDKKEEEKQKGTSEPPSAMSYVSQKTNVGEITVHGGWAKETGGGTDFSALAEDLMSPQYSSNQGFYGQNQRFEMGNINPIEEFSPNKEHEEAYNQFGPESPAVAENEGHNSLIHYTTNRMNSKT